MGREEGREEESEREIALRSNRIELTFITDGQTLEWKHKERFFSQ